MHVKVSNYNLLGEGEDEKDCYSGALQDKSRKPRHKASSPARLTFMKSRTKQLIEVNTGDDLQPSRRQGIYCVKKMIDHLAKTRSLNMCSWNNRTYG